MAFTAANISRLLPVDSGTARYFGVMSQLDLAQPLVNEDIPLQVKRVAVRAISSFLAIEYFSGSGAAYNLGSAIFESGRAVLARRANAQDEVAILNKVADHVVAGCLDVVVFLLSQFIITALLLSLIYALFPQQTASVVTTGLQWTSEFTHPRIERWAQPQPQPGPNPPDDAAGAAGGGRGDGAAHDHVA